MVSTCPDRGFLGTWNFGQRNEVQGRNQRSQVASLALGSLGPRELPDINKQHRAIMKAGSCHPNGLRAFSSSPSRPDSLVDQLQFLYNCQCIRGV